MNTLARLQSLYRQLDRDAAAGEDVVADLRKEINNLELSYLKDEVFPKVADYLGAQIKNLRCEIDCSIQFSEDSRINYSFCTSGSTLLIKDSIDAKNCVDNGIKAIVSNVDEANANVGTSNYGAMKQKTSEYVKRTKAKPIGIRSIKAENIYVNDGNSTKKYLDFINQIGPKLVYDMKINYLGGPLVDLKPNPKYEGTSRQLNGGYWININSSTQTKINQIRRICANLGMSVEFEMDSDEPKIFYDKEVVAVHNESVVTPTKNERAYFSLNGGEPLTKRRAVLEAVKLYIKENPEASFLKIKGAFPDQLQGSYGVVANLLFIDMKISNGHNFSNRYFLEEKDILTSADGVRFAVCNQWGNQFPIFQRHVAQNFGWTLVAAESNVHNSADLIPTKEQSINIGSDLKHRDNEETLFTNESFDSKPIVNEPQKNVLTQDEIVIKDYSSRFIIVYGNTEPLSKLFSVCGGAFNPNLEDGNAWLFPKFREDDVRKIVSNHIKSKLHKKGQSPIEEFKLYLISNGSSTNKKYSYFTVQEFAKLMLSDYIVSVVKKFDSSGDIFKVEDDEILQNIYDIVNYDCKYRRTNIKYWHAISAYRRFFNSKLGKK